MIKTSFVIKSMECSLTINGETQSIKTPEIHTQLEATIGELKGLYELQKKVLEESPAILETFTNQFINALASVQQTFEKVDSNFESKVIKESNIDEWFREYFIGDNVTEEAKRQFMNYFANQNGNPILIDRVSFFNIPFSAKEKFFNYVCGTCF